MRNIARGCFGEMMEETCQYDWPTDCHVQGGKRGIVFTDNGENSYRTAFIEVFPKTPQTFIRGEGKTIAEAETSVWNKYQKILTCSTNPEHGPFERRNYTNGYGFCLECGMGKSDVFEIIEDPNRKPGFLEKIFKSLSD